MTLSSPDLAALARTPVGQRHERAPEKAAAGARRALSILDHHEGRETARQVNVRLGIQGCRLALAQLGRDLAGEPQRSVVGRLAVELLHDDVDRAEQDRRRRRSPQSSATEAATMTALHTSSLGRPAARERPYRRMISTQRSHSTLVGGSSRGAIQANSPRTET